MYIYVYTYITNSPDMIGWLKLLTGLRTDLYTFINHDISLNILVILNFNSI